MPRPAVNSFSVRGFTLIELLVVIAIIAILAGMLLPALSTAKARGQKTYCTNNLKQMGVSMQLYQEDFNGNIPRGNNPLWWQVFIPNLGGRTPTATVNQYTNIGVYRCPSYPDRRQLICYVVNGWQFANPRDTVGAAVDGVTKIDRVQRPSETIYLADNENGAWRPVFTKTNILGDMNLNDVWSPEHLPYVSNAPNAPLNPERRVAARRHGMGSNLLYFDVHVDWRNGRRIKIDDWREQKY